MLEKLYKLTNQDGQTYRSTQWGVDITHTASGGKLCTAGVLHAYRDPLLGLLLNPMQSNFISPRLWEAEGEVCSEDWDKVGCTSLTTLVELPLPEITTEMRVRFAILCAAQVTQSIEWLVWAENWWSGRDRSEEAAKEAAEVATWAAAWAVEAAKWMTEWVARSAARAAWAAIAAQAVAKKVAGRSVAMERAGKKIDFIKLAHWACEGFNQ